MTVRRSTSVSLRQYRLGKATCHFHRARREHHERNRISVCELQQKTQLPAPTPRVELGDRGGAASQCLCRLPDPQSRGYGQPSFSVFVGVFTT